MPQACISPRDTHSPRDIVTLEPVINPAWLLLRQRDFRNRHERCVFRSIPIDRGTQRLQIVSCGLLTDLHCRSRGILMPSPRLSRSPFNVPPTVRAIYLRESFATPPLADRRRGVYEKLT